MTNKSASRIANRLDANIHSLATKVVQKCTELETIDESACPDMLPPRMAKIAAELDRLEKKIAKIRAGTIDGLRAKAAAASNLDRFGYTQIQNSIVRDLIAMAG